MAGFVRTAGQASMLPGAVRAGALVYTSGIISPSAFAALGTGETVAVEQQTAEAFEALLGALADAGAQPQHVVKLEVFLSSSDSFDALNREFLKIWPDPGPARTTVIVELADPSILIEVQAVAVVE